MPQRIDAQAQARRVAREFSAGNVVALGPGIPGLVPLAVQSDAPLQFLADSGALGYGCEDANPATGPDQLVVDSNGRAAFLKVGGTCLSTVDMAAMVRARQVAVAVLQPAFVTAAGDFIHWTTNATPGLDASGTAIDLASAAGRVVAMMPHVGPDGAPTIVATAPFQPDVAHCVDLIVTDAAVIRVGTNGLVLEELAPGWTADEVLAITGAPISLAPELKEMDLGRPSWEPVSKVYSNGLDAVQDIPDGSVVNIDGFAGPGGMPHYLMVALRDHGARDLTIISNTAGLAQVINFGTPPGKRAIDHSILVDNHQIKKAIASYPVSPSASRPTSFELAYQGGVVELEVVPQGTLAERIRAGGAGVEAFYTPTAAGTLLAEGKETRVIDGREYVLEEALRLIIA